MKPDEFSTIVMPQISDLWSKGCLCRSPGFRKLMSFHFRDYGPSPWALFDLEAICHEIVRARFREIDAEKRLSAGGGWLSTFECPTCGTGCQLTLEQFNINFECTRVKFDGTTTRAATGVYLVGFYGLGRQYPPADFREASTIAEFLSALSG